VNNSHHNRKRLTKIFSYICLVSQLTDTSSNLSDVTSSFVPVAPDVIVPLVSPTPLEVTHEVLNSQSPILSSPILYQNVNQNTVMDVQNVVNHTQHVE